MLSNYLIYNEHYKVEYVHPTSVEPDGYLCPLDSLIELHIYNEEIIIPHFTIRCEGPKPPCELILPDKNTIIKNIMSYNWKLNKGDWKYPHKYIFAPLFLNRSKLKSKHIIKFLETRNDILDLNDDHNWCMKILLHFAEDLQQLKDYINSNDFKNKNDYIEYIDFIMEVRTIENKLDQIEKDIMDGKSIIVNKSTEKEIELSKFMDRSYMEYDDFILPPQIMNISIIGDKCEIKLNYKQSLSYIRDISLKIKNFIFIPNFVHNLFSDESNADEIFEIIENDDINAIQDIDFPGYLYVNFDSAIDKNIIKANNLSNNKVFNYIKSILLEECGIYQDG